MSPVSIGFAALLAAWFALSVLAHLRSAVRQRFPQLEAWGLIPHWNFFAPRPGVHDVHLLYRDFDPDGSAGQLDYVPMIGARRWYQLVWHPDKYRSKVVSDIAATIQSLNRRARENEADPRLLMLSQPYLLALHLVMRMPRRQGTAARQFILARHREGESQHRLVFFSERHPFADFEPERTA